MWCIMFGFFKGMLVGKEITHTQSSFIGTVAVTHRDASVHMGENIKEPQGTDTTLMTLQSILVIADTLGTVIWCP